MQMRGRPARAFTPLPLPSTSTCAARWSRDTRAEVGIGTMIVFIASILVAAIAAGVLIGTSQKLQAKSTQTGNEATRGVSSGLLVLDIDGIRSNTTNGAPVDELEMWVQLAAGADPVDLSTLALNINNGNAKLDITTCNPGGSVASDTQFASVIVRGTAQDCGTVNSGDLVVMHMGLASGTPIPVLPGGIAAQEEVTIHITPLSGLPLLVRFTAPDMGSSTHVDLF